jgi:hypothetical protein
MNPEPARIFPLFWTSFGNPTLTFIIRAGKILCAAKTPPKSRSIEHVWGGYEAHCLRLSVRYRKNLVPYRSKRKLRGALRHRRQTLSVSNAMHK